MTADTPVALYWDGPTLTVTLSRPEARNAVDAAMLAGVEEACSVAANDRDCRVVLLRGAGGFFCSGGDRKERAALIAAGDREALAARSRREGQLLAAIAALPKPVVVAIEGGAIGLGLALAASADLVLAARPARFAAPEVTFGALPAQIAPALVRRLGLGHARRMLVTGAMIDADEAFRIGLVHAVLPDGAALAGALAVQLDTLGRLEPAAVAAVKGVLDRVVPPDPGYPDAAAAAYAAWMMDR